jgi:hypothetical protein
MVDISSQEKKINIKIQSGGAQANVSVTQDLAQYYSEKSREWATSNRIVDGVDYSSKYYANKANESAAKAENAKKVVTEAKDGLIVELQQEAQIQTSTIQQVSQLEQEEIQEVINRIEDGKAVYMGEDEPTDPIYTVWVSPEDNEFDLKLDEIEQKLEKVNGAYVGQTIFSLDPLFEDGLHLYDGALLPIGGVYNEFITKYIANLYETNPERFCTEEEWQASVVQYGVCGKYVYNEGVSVRLPKVTGFVEGTLDASALGELVEAGLPNIKGSFGTFSQKNYNDTTGCFTASYNYGSTTSGGSTFGSGIVNIDASLSNPIYGNLNTVQPQAIKGYYYIVVATGTKTDVDTNIDNIAVDLNGKADTDLSNVSASQSFKSQVITWGIPDYANGIIPAHPTSSAPFTAPSDGMFVDSFYYNTSNASSLFVNGIQTKIVMRTGESYRDNKTSVTVPLSKGDVIYWSTGATTTFGIGFYPFKGSN